MRKSILVSLLAASSVLCASLYAAQAAATESGPPEHVLYLLLFRRIQHFSTAEAAAKANGTSGPVTRHFIRDRMGLSDAEASVLEQTSAECNTELSALDQRAQTLIDSIHAANPGGRLQPGEKLPTPSSELAELDQQRKETVLRYRTLVETRLGSTGFARFQQYAAEAASKMHRIQASSSARQQSGGVK